MGFVLAVHVVAGAAGLLLGPVAMAAPKRRGRHTGAGTAYQVAAAGMTSTSVVLAAADPAALWWLGFIGVATEAAALGGWWLARYRPRGWLLPHINLLCGSYISFLTAFLVVNWSSPMAWLLPTTVGSPLIGWTTARYARQSSRPSRTAVDETSARSTSSTTTSPGIG